RHSLGWPVAIPGLFPDTKPLAADPFSLLARAAGMVIGQDGGDSRIEITDSGVKIGADATEYVALASKVVSFLTNLFDGWAPAANDGGAALKTRWTSLKASIDLAAGRTKAQ